MECKYCGGQCSCHIAAPCTFCTEHCICDICGELVCEDKAIEAQDKSDGSAITICPDCDEKYADNGDR